MAGGRPSKYSPELCEKLIDHMKEGNSFETFAAVAGCGVSTLYDWCKNYPEFSEAKKKAFALSQRVWEDLGLKMAKEGNATIWIFCMKNRFGWKDKQEQEIKSESSIKIEIADDESEL